MDDRPNPGELRAGDRAPDAFLSDGMRFFDVLRGPHFTLLAFGGATVSSDTRLRVLRVGTLEGYDVHDGDFVLVRPDGYIATITSSLETTHQVMSNFFGAG